MTVVNKLQAKSYARCAISPLWILIFKNNSLRGDHATQIVFIIGQNRYGIQVSVWTNAMQNSNIPSPVIPLIWELTTVNAYILLPFTDFQSKVNNYYITNYHVISFNFRFKTSCRQNYQLITVKSKIN